MRRNYFVDFARQEGIEEGTLAEARKNVLRVLRRRFGQLGDELSQAVERIEDIGRLEMLLEEAAVAPTLEAFLSLLKPTS